MSDQARLVDNEICQGIPSRRPRGSKRIRVHAAAGNTTETYSVSSHGEFSIVSFHGAAIILAVPIINN